MKDVTKSHAILAKRFRKSITRIQAYRRYTLGIYLRGFNYQLENIRDTVDWTLPDIAIARLLKVSPETVEGWRLQLFGKPDKRVRLSNEQQTEIANSSERSTKLAVKYGVTVWTINRVRRQRKTAAGIGRPKLTVGDFPADTNWNVSTRQLAKNLGVSWSIADRLRTEALTALSSSQTDLNLQLDPDSIDWTASTSLLSAQLKLDKNEVYQLKSTARRNRRNIKVA